MRVLVAPGPSPAGANIYGSMQEVYDFTSGPNNFGGVEVLEYHDTQQHVLLAKTPRLIDEMSDEHARHIEKEIGRLDLIVMGAWHEGGPPRLLTIRTGGNPTAPSDRISLARSPASIMKTVCQELARHVETEGLDRSISMEPTHGPAIGFRVPFMVVEIGSRPDEWIDNKAGMALATAIRAALAGTLRHFPNVLALGGSHYSSKVTRLLRDTRYAVAHFFSENQMDDLAPSALRQAAERSEGPSPVAVIIKMKREGREKALDLCKMVGLETKKYGDLLA